MSGRGCKSMLSGSTAAAWQNQRLSCSAIYDIEYILCCVVFALHPFVVFYQYQSSASVAPCLAAAANQCSLGAWRRHHGAAAWRNQRLRCAAGRRRGVYDIECSLCCCRRAGPWSTVEYWRAAPATAAAAVLLLYVVVRLSVSEVKQGTLPAQPRAYYSSYPLTLLLLLSCSVVCVLGYHQGYILLSGLPYSMIL